MSEGSKVMNFGKMQNQIGDLTSHICLQTAGDVYVKTKNKQVRIFKDGKLDVGNSSEIFQVDSIDKIKKTGIYLVTSKDETEEGSEGANQSVYLNVDGVKILLASSSEGYLSYTSVQELKAEEFLQAALNLGLYFNTADDVKAAGITQGLVYILEDQKLYKVVDGELTDLNTVTGSEAGGQDTEDEPSEQELDSIKIGAILIDGTTGEISVEGGLTIIVDGFEFIKFENNKIWVLKDMIFDPKNQISFKGGIRGESGLHIYYEDGESYVETDNLIVHNTTESYTPKLYSTTIGSSVQSMIRGATWVNSPTDIQLDLKYPADFKEGDHIVIQTAGGNEAKIKGDLREGTYYLIVELDVAPAQTTTIKVDFESEDGETTGSATVTINPNDYDPSEGDEPNNYGEVVVSALVGEVTNFEVTSGDQDIFYISESGVRFGESSTPMPLYGTVTSTSPLVINVPGQTNPASSVLRNLEYSIINKIVSQDSEEYTLHQNSENISLIKATDSGGTMTTETSSKIGNLEDIPNPADPSETLEGEGMYSDNFVGKNPKFFGGTFEGSGPEWYPTYGTDLNTPADFDDAAYDKVVPCVDWVKQLIDKKVEEAIASLTPPPVEP